MPKKPTIQASFTIDKQEFDKSIKDLNKQVNNAKKDFNEINKEVKTLAKELSEVSKQAKDLGMKDVENQVKGVVNELKNVSKEFTNISKEVTKTKKEINEMGKIDLSNVNKFSSILKSLRNFDIIKENNLRRAVDDARELARTLNGINNISVDVNGIGSRVNSLDVLARNTSGNSYADNFVDGDQARYFNRIIEQITKIRESVDKKPKEVNDKLITYVDKLTKTINDAVGKLTKAMNNNNGYTPNYKEANYKEPTYQTVNPIVQTTNPFDSNELASIAKLVDLWDQAQRNAQQYNKYLSMSEKDQKQISDEFARQCKETDELLATTRQIEKENEEIKKENQQITEEVNEQNKTLDTSVNKLRKVYDVIAKILGGAGIKLPSFDAMAEGARRAGVDVDGLATSLFGAEAASGAASGAVAGLTAGIAALLAIIVAVVAVVAAYVIAMNKLVNIMKQASTVASQFEGAVVKLSNQLGTATESTGKLRDILNETFRDQGITSDINEMAEALRVVSQYLDIDIDTEFGQQMAEQIMVVSRTTGYEAREIGRTMDSIATNFGISQTEALDSMLYMFQTTGDKSNDLLDTMNEYSSKVKDLGITYETFLSTIKAADDASLMNLDKAGQFFEELNDTLTTEPDVAIENLNKLGISYSKAMEQIKKGGKDADKTFYTIISRINEMQDEAEKQNLIAELFKSPGQEVSQAFVDILENTKVEMQDVAGAAEEAHQKMVNTIEYQQNEFHNKIQSLYDKIGEGINELLLPILKNINDNFDSIWGAVETKLVPAFQDLMYAIAFAFGIKEPSDFSEVLIFIVDCVVKVIEWVTKATIFFRKLFDAFGILYDSLKVLFKFLEAGLVILGGMVGIFVAGFINGLFAISGTAVGVVEGLVRSFDDAFMLIIKGLGNLGIGFANIITYAAKGAYNAFLKYFVNPAIKAANLLPSVDINQVGLVNNSLKTFDYISIKDELGGLKDAWTTDNKGFNFVSETSKSSVEAMKKMLGLTFDGVVGSLDGLGDDFASIGKRWDNIGTSFEDYKSEFNKNFGIQTEELSDRLDQIVENTGTNPPPVYNDGTIDGTDKTPEQIAAEKAAAEKAAEEAKKLAEEQRKEYEQALKDAQQAQYDYYKELIAYLQEVQSKRIEYETQIAEQQWKAQEMSIDLLQDQYDFYGSIMDRYILSTDEMISYSQKQYDIALQMKEYALSEAKKLIQEELDAKKDALKEEEDALIKSNNEKIKEYEKYIKEIERQISDLENSWEDEDRQEEIDKVKAELEKYKYATSTEGIKKHQELEEELNDLLKEKERDEIKDRLEDQKEGWQEQIDGLEDTNDKIKEEYEDKYKELEEMITTSEMEIADIQEYIRDQANATLKKQLQEMVDAYNNALSQMKESALSMETILGWEQIDQNRQDIVNGLTGEKDNDFKDLINRPDEQINPDYVKIKELQEQWNALGDGKNSTNPLIKAQQDALNKQANAIRAKYGLKYPDLPPKYLPKYHEGGLVDETPDENNEVHAKLLNGEVVLPVNLVQSLTEFLNGFKLNNSMFGKFVPQTTMTNITYNNNLSFNIDTIQMNNKMDTRKMLQEAETYRKTRANSIGKRTL